MKIKIASCILFLMCFTIATSFAQYVKAEWTERNGWMQVSQILDYAGVKEGALVGDVGCHEGYLSFHLSNRVGAMGKVYAVDVEEDRLENLREHIKDSGVHNIEVVLGDFDDPKLPLAKLDAVLVMDTYHEIDDSQQVLEHIRLALKPGGRLLLLEKLKQHAKDKSREEQTAAHTLSPRYVKEDLEQAGFRIVQEIEDFGNWQNDPTKVMWILVAVKTGD